ncbi:unnamed protein product [Adineta steineri]|uniref:Protein kinase domain-containing protein n=1 Tax=Adineta steineri TaxID=433720 RepID=A0A815BQ41_9BILA|nr:unnamed protein product [Adineta steineri]CAF4017199.1 unnamed protein product [Adineta steineri]
MCAARSMSTTKTRNKLALVIGINNYKAENQLKNSVNDATDLAGILKTIGFDVKELFNATYDEMKVLLDTFVESIQSNDMVLFYFAGHGHQWKDQNYLIPSKDDYIEDETIKEFAFNAQEILNHITEKRPFVAILLLDCCHEYHLRHHDLKGVSQGLKDVVSRKGLKKIYNASHSTNVLIAFACAPGEISYDVSVNDQNSLFTWHLLQHIAQPNQDIAMILRNVAQGVQNETMNKMIPQVPWINCSLNDLDIFLYSICDSEPQNIERLSTMVHNQLALDNKFHLGGSLLEEALTTATENTAAFEIHDTFESRYETDYQTIKILGKGGFGYVFEAINKLDGRRLAVKRVSFQSERGGEKALKEVRALVRLDHPYIIPYYHTWIEIPPVGWQRREDETYDCREFSKEATYTISDSKIANLDASSTNTTVSQAAIGEQDHSDEESDDGICFLQSYEKNTVESTHTSSPSDSSAGVSEAASSYEQPNKQDKSIVPTKTSYLYYSMKLCEGEPLEQRLNPYKLIKEQACNIVHQITEGIAYIHQEKLIHGDIKPANIFFAAGNLIKIGDFGLAVEMLENNQMVITSRQNPGTHSYMAPELRKKEEEIQYDEKVDIYAMGIVFLEVLAPFKTGSERVMVSLKAMIK